jgi:hypothetical protein
MAGKRIPYVLSEPNNRSRIPAGLTGDLPTKLADQTVGPDSDPLVSDARRLLPFRDLLGFPAGHALDDEGAQAEEHSQQAGVYPR